MPKAVVLLTDHLRGRLEAIARRRRTSLNALVVAILTDAALDFEEQQQDGMEVRKED